MFTPLVVLLQPHAKIKRVILKSNMRRNTGSMDSRLLVFSSAQYGVILSVDLVLDY